jgi:hypothetical protein
MKESGESLRDDSRALGEREAWVEQNLGAGWTEVEPGIYRFEDKTIGTVVALPR